MKDVKKGIQADPNMAQISGKVTLQGKPLNYGFITLVDAAGKRFSANITKDGDYNFRVGIPPGEYSVVVEGTTSPPEAGEIRAPIPEKYKRRPRRPCGSA